MALSCIIFTLAY